MDNFCDVASLPVALSAKESHRLAILRSYRILDTPEEEDYDRFTRLAARLFGVSTALISLVDEDRQWFKSRFGLTMCGSAREVSFCSHVVDADAPLIVSDTRNDPRFASNPFVTENPKVRFYAGVPLRAPEGAILGTLCLLDDKPREFSDADLAQLSDLAEMVMDKMKLRHKKQFYRSLVEDGSEMVTIFKENGDVIYQSPSVERLLGYPFQEIYNSKLLDLVHPDDQAGVVARYTQMIEEKSDLPLHRYRFLHKNGSWRTIECYARYALDDNEIGGIVSISRDVTQHAQMEQQLNQIEARFEATFDQSSLGMAMVNLDGSLLRINRKFAEMSGIEIARLSQYHYRELMLPEEIENSTQNAERLISGEIATLSIERRLTRRDGQSFWAQFTVSLVRKVDGEPDYLLAQVQDIDARRKQNERLRLLESVAVHANDAILITAAEPVEEDENGPRILYANEAYCKMSGYTLEEVIGKTPRIMQGEGTDPEARAQIRRALKRWKPVVVEILNYTRAGVPFWVELSIFPVSDEKGWYTHWVSVQRDVTARKQSEATLHRTNEEAQAARQEAEAANRAKSEFLSRMSHELRTPLNAILGFGQLLELEDQTPNNRESTDQILRAGRHLLELINEVLDISRIETGSMSMSLEPVSIAEVARETLDLVRSMAAQYGISLREEGVFNSRLSLAGDRRRVKQVLLNLLSNAIKYNRRGGHVTLSVESIPAVTGGATGGATGERAERVRVRVTDSGAGIAPEKRERLWVPFDRLDAETTGIEGTGIGLALSYRLAQAMNGQLDFRSSEQGSTFWLELPCAHPTASGFDESADLDASATDCAPQSEILWQALYIEDNLPNVQLMEGILAHRPQVRLLSAGQGALGIELARQNRPDVILLDLHLPDINGDEVLRQLRADDATRQIPIVMISADATPGQIERMLAAGANDYLSKPFGIAHFLRVLDDCIALSETRKIESLSTDTLATESLALAQLVA